MIRRFFHSTIGEYQSEIPSYTFFNETDNPNPILYNDRIEYSNGFNIQLGMKFQVSSSGYIIGGRFWKDVGNIGIHTAQLYDSSGTLLASEQYVNETDSGWQEQLFSTPVLVSANTTYITSYYSGDGYYSVTSQYFTSDITRTPITALDGNGSTTNGNGVYKYTNAPILPNDSYNDSNYWVDLIFQTEL